MTGDEKFKVVRLYEQIDFAPGGREEAFVHGMHQWALEHPDRKLSHRQNAYLKMLYRKYSARIARSLGGPV